MTGFPHPMKLKPPRKTKMLTSGMITVPTRSRWERGSSVTRPWERGVSSPSRSATIACPHSWNMMLTTSRMKMISPSRMNAGSKFMPLLSPVGGQPRNQLLRLPLQGRLRHRAQPLAGLVRPSHVDEDVGLVQAHRLALEVGLGPGLQPLPRLQRGLPVRVAHVVERLRVPVGELDPVRGQLGRVPEGLVHGVVVRVAGPFAALEELVPGLVEERAQL